MTKPNRGWIWYFAVLIFLSILATTTLIVYNLRLQLKPEQLEAAHKLWDQKGPRDYTLTYLVRKNDETTTDRFVVTVKGGAAVQSQFNGVAEEPERLPHRGMGAMFNDVERFMENDTKAGAPRVYVRAIFDEQNGAILWYVHRVMGGTQRVEITVESLEAIR